MSKDRCTTHHICDCRQAMLEKAQREVERLKAAPLRLQADRLMQEVNALSERLKEVNALQERTYQLNIEVSEKIAELELERDVR